MSQSTQCLGSVVPLAMFKLKKAKSLGFMIKLKMKNENEKAPALPNCLFAPGAKCVSIHTHTCRLSRQV